jgi:hypothetical protein
MEIVKLLTKVMEDAGAVRKTERNTHQQFNFRGIDNVVNAVSPALRKHGVVVVPTLNHIEYEQVEIGERRTRMGYVRINVTYTFYAPDGTSIATTVAAESMDSGDKATAKAMSVAFRTCLLQTLCLPTDESDPDADTYVRSDAPMRPLRAVDAPEPAASKPAPVAKAADAAKPRAVIGSAARQPAKKAGNGVVTDNQINFMHTVAKQIEADDSLLTDLAQDKPLKDLTAAEASLIIEKLLAVKRGNATLIFNDNGKADIEMEEEQND